MYCRYLYLNCLSAGWAGASVPEFLFQSSLQKHNLFLLIHLKYLSDRYFFFITVNIITGKSPHIDLLVVTVHSVHSNLCTEIARQRFRACLSRVSPRGDSEWTVTLNLLFTQFDIRLADTTIIIPDSITLYNKKGVTQGLLSIRLLSKPTPPRGVFTRFLRDQTKAIRIIAWTTCAKPLFCG